ncbi:hypothetical protein [Erythrobacter oryzae]|uniref:hypothetical protein n=1 Tax=Erythrobacter oryzae TaxID=3019556 RepID=UPI0025550373|nr:hypothetical protein [Erythrobacter sp. COR-2]
MTSAHVLTGAALAAGLVLAAMLGLLYLTGDCWSAHATPDAIRACEIDKRSGMFAFLGVAGGLWLAGATRAARGRPFAKRLGLFSGPVAFLAVSVLF